MSETKPITLTGGYQCGKKRYRIQGSVVEPTAVCYFRMCQKAMGNIFGIFISFNIEVVIWTRDKADQFQSSSIDYRLFCSHCGTPLAFLPIDEKTIELTVGCLDHSEEMAPMEQTGTENQIDWIKTIFDLTARPTYENHSETIHLINYQHPDHD